VRLSVATKIFLCFVAVLVTFGSVSITAIWSLHTLGEDLGVVSECYLPLTSSVAQIQIFQENRERDNDRLLGVNDRATERVMMGYTRAFFPKMMRDRVAAARAVVQRSRPLARHGDLEFLNEMDRELTSLSDRYGKYNDAASALYDAISRDPAARRGPHGGWDTPVLDGRPHKPGEPKAEPAPPPALSKEDAALSPDELIKKKATALKDIGVSITGEVQILSSRLETRVARRVNDVHRAELQLVWAIIGLTFAAILVGLLATGIAQRTLQPIRVLTEGVKGISRGDFALEVPPRSNDELGILVREFNAMAASLRQRERQLLEQRELLLRSERLAAIGRVSAQVTHEIRNPLSSIGLNAELLGDELDAATFADPKKRQEAIDLLSAMAKEIDRLTEISEQYLAFARPPRQGLDKVELNEVVENLLGFLQPELQQAGVTVQLELAAELPAVVGDEGQLRQALRNLIRNAREAMAPRGGRLTVRTRLLPSSAPGTQVSIEVMDEGPGVAPEALTNLFDPFYSTKEQGTGLGLALTQQIAADHGGTLSCQSPPGHGATFVLTLPADDAPHPRPTTEPAAPPTASV
jgi:signal transduction histidine kinase